MGRLLALSSNRIRCTGRNAGKVIEMKAELQALGERGAAEKPTADDPQSKALDLST